MLIDQGARTDKVAETADFASDTPRKRRDPPRSAASVLGGTTVMVLTYNEAPNIGRTLEKLTWAHRVLVIDSFSTDETLAIAKRFPNVDVLQRRFDSFAGQCNFGLAHVDSEWVLSLDADYVLSDELCIELATLEAGQTVNG